MLIVDPAAQFIDAQLDTLTDFIFRMTGDRSRAGVMATEVCRMVKDDLSSQWGNEEIRLQLFRLCFELNEDALRGLDKHFLENYYRHQFPKATDVARFYPWEYFLTDLTPTELIPFLLKERYEFNVLLIPELLGVSAEEIETKLQAVEEKLKGQKKLNRADLPILPNYGFLVAPDLHHSSLSVIMKSLDTQKPKSRKLLVLYCLLGGLGLGALIYAFW